MEIAGCPWEADRRQPDVTAALRFAELADKGALPAGGGALEQTQKFLDAWEFIRSEQAWWKARQPQE